MTGQEPEIIFCENCDAEILTDEAIMRSDNALWCQTCDDNNPLDDEDAWGEEDTDEDKEDSVE